MISLSRDGRQTLACMLCPNNSLSSWHAAAAAASPGRPSPGMSAWLSRTVHLESWQPDIYRHMTTYTRYMWPYPMPCHMASYTKYMWSYTFPEFLYWVYHGIYFSEKYMTSYDGIWRYRYITVYEGSWPSYVSIWQIFSTYPCHGYWCSWYKNSYIWYMRAHPAQLCSRMLLWLVYAGSSCGPALLFPGCTRLARLNAAHLLRPKGTLG